jgi:cytochrome c2
MVLILGATLTGGAQAADVPDGRQLFKKYCTHCHSVRTLTPVVRNRQPAEREDFLVRYIASHHGPPNPVEPRALAAYLSKAVE